MGIANAEEGSNIYTSFIAFKVHLERKDSAAACEELCSMLKSADFSVDFLTVQCQQLSFVLLSFHGPPCCSLQQGMLRSKAAYMPSRVMYL